jgi:hypothetical protein
MPCLGADVVIANVHVLRLPGAAVADDVADRDDGSRQHLLAIAAPGAVVELETCRPPEVVAARHALHVLPAAVVHPPMVDAYPTG